jgi:exportin-T
MLRGTTSRGSFADRFSLQVENAINIAADPKSSQDLKAQAFEFINQLRNDASSWQVCLSLFTRTPKASEVVRHVTHEVLNSAINSQQLDQQTILYIKEHLLEYARSVYGGSASQDQIDSPNVQNKLAQTLTSVFAVTYKQGWESFFDDFLSLTMTSGSSVPDNINGVALYLRILDSVHDEIADVLLARSGGEQKRNNELKDLVRDRAVQKIAKSWQTILTCWQGKNDSVVEKCLGIIGRYVSWIDISLVVNQEFLTLLLQLIGRSTTGNGEDKVRDAAIGCLTETVAKKMKSGDKIDMIVFLGLGDIVLQLLASPALANSSSPNYDVDFADAVAKLVNVTVSDIVRALEDSADGSDARVKADQQLHLFLPHLLRLFSDEFDEPCSTLIPSLTDLLTLFRKAKPLPAQYQAMLTPILNAVISKMRYDDTADWEDQASETDGAEFLGLRKRLEVLQKTIAAVDADLYIEVLTNVVATTFQNMEQNGSNTNWRDVDLALYEMFLFGELAVPNSGLYAKSQPSSVASERLVAMMTKMIQSGKLKSPEIPYPIC